MSSISAIAQVVQRALRDLVDRLATGNHAPERERDMFYPPPSKVDDVGGQRLTNVETRVVERVLKMTQGYLLDFSHRTLTEFFEDYAVDFSDPKYEALGTSKANKLRAFLRTAPLPLAVGVLGDLLKERLRSPPPPPDEDLVVFRGLLERLRAGTPAAPGERPPPTLRADVAVVVEASVPATSTPAPPPVVAADPRVLLHDLILATYSETEFTRLARTGPGGDATSDLPGDVASLSVRVDAYIAWCARRDLLPDLCDALAEARPRRAGEVARIRGMLEK